MGKTLIENRIGERWFAPQK